MKKLLIIPLIIFITGKLLSQNPSYECKIYQLFVSEQIDDWEEVMTEIELIYKKEPTSNLLLLLAQTEYGYIGYLLGEEMEDKAEVFLKKLDQHIIKLENYPLLKAETFALRGAWYAFEFKIHPTKIFSLGPKSIENIDLALENNPNSPNALIEKGNAEYHMPRMFGGSYQEAANNYKKAIDVMETKHLQKCSWKYINTLIWLAKCYEEMEEYPKAVKIYDKIIEFEPNFKPVQRYRSRIINQ